MATKIKGITIEVGGDTSQFEKSLRDANKSIKDTQTALKDVDKLLKLDPGNTELLTQKQKLLKDAISDTKEKLQLLKDAQSGVAQGTPEWDALQREIIETEQKLDGLNGKMKEFGSVTSQQLQAAGKKIQDVGNGVKGAGEAFAPVSAAAGALVGGLAGLGYKAVTAADDLNTLSKQTGISTDDLQKMQYASDMVDVSVDDIVGSMKKMKKNMDSDSKDVQAAWDQLGVSVRDASTGQMRPAIDVFYDAIGALSAVENETERDQLAMNLFGKSADSLAGVIDDGGAALQAYGQQAEDMGLILSGDTLNSINAVNDTIDQTKATVGATMMEVGAKVAETLAPTVETVAGLIGQVMEKLREIDPGILQIIMVIGLVVAAIAPLLIIIGTVISSVGTIVTSIGTLSGFISGTLIPAITAIGAPVLAVIAVITAIIATLVLLYQHNEDFRNKVNAIWEQVKQTITTVVQLIQAVIQKFISAAQSAWQRWGSTILNVAQSVWNAIYTAISTAITLIQDILRIIMAAINGDWTAVWNGIKQFATDLWNGLKATISASIEAVKTVINTVLNAIKGIWDTIWNAIKQKVEEIWNGIKTTVSNILEGVKSTIGQVKETITSKIGEAVSYIKSLPSQALTWGRDLISNFVDGIKEKIHAVTDVISDVADAVTDFIGFSEPDKGPLSRFHTFAPDMMELFSKGIRDNLGLVSSAMNDVAGTVAGDMTRMAMVNVTSNTFLNGRMIASEINHELGAML